MGDSDSSEFDVITVKESETAPPLPVAQDLLIKKKPGGAASFSWEINRALLLRDLISSRQRFRQVSGVYVVALSKGDSTV